MIIFVLSICNVAFLNRIETMLSPYLSVKPVNNKGRGVFSSHAIPAETVVELSPVIVMKKEERVHLDKTLLHDYIFEWGH